MSEDCECADGSRDGRRGGRDRRNLRMTASEIRRDGSPVSAPPWRLRRGSTPSRTSPSNHPTPHNMLYYFTSCVDGIDLNGSSLSLVKPQTVTLPNRERLPPFLLIYNSYFPSRSARTFNQESSPHATRGLPKCRVYKPHSCSLFWVSDWANTLSSSGISVTGRRHEPEARH
jgi:hypothetical protein